MFFELLFTLIKFMYLCLCISVTCAISIRVVPACVVGLRGLLEVDLYFGKRSVFEASYVYM